MSALQGRVKATNQQVEFFIDTLSKRSGYGRYALH